jgi:hypothetical protein
MNNLVRIFSLVCCAIVFTTTVSQNRDVQILPIGSQAPDFNLRGIDNKNYSLKDCR